MSGTYLFQIRKMFVAALIFIAALLKSSSAACSKTVSCPCGSSNKNFTFCVDESILQGRPCERWSFCETCRDGQNYCASCPIGLTGALCNSANYLLTRKKRQFRRPSQKRSPNQKYIQLGNCPPVKSPENGAISCTETRDRGECVGRCIPGYSFEGEESSREIRIDCRGGRWTPRKRFPPCKSGDFCKLVSGRASNSYNCSIGMEGTKCDIRCEGRFWGTYTCFPGREWSPPLPYCVKAKEPNNPRTPPLCSCLYGGTCDVNGVCVCPPGRTGQHCEREERVRCSDPGTPRGGYRTNLDGSPTPYGRPFEVGNALIYSCPRRYLLTGAQVITCMRDATWSSPLPRCVLDPVRFCPELGPVPFAEYSPSPTGMYAEGDTVSYQCIPGYALSGLALLTCLKSGYWNGRKPTCLRIPTTTTTTTTTAHPGFPCTHPGVDRNGEVNDSPLDPRGRSSVVLQPGIRLTYTCNDGYQLVGPDVIICLSTGRWTDSRPQCEKIEVSSPSEVTRFCAYPGDVANGRVLPRVYEEQVRALTELEIVCNVGFELNGPDAVLCQPSGIWSNNFPTCDPIVTRTLLSCSPPDLDPNAFIADTMVDSRSIGHEKQESYLAGSLVRVQCGDGYQLSGDDELYCLNTGAWSKPSPVCERKPRAKNIDCEKVDPISHGFIEISGAGGQGMMYPPGTQLHYHCKQGYHLKGVELRVCESFGYWSEDPPACVPDISCPVVTVDHGGVMITLPSGVGRVRGRSRYPEGTRVTFSCAVGYALSGTETLTCLNMGEWSDDPPVCFEDCGVSSLSADKRISFASRTLSGEWPWMVAVSRPRGPLVCGGALLDARTVLTAAHCFAGSYPFFLFRFGKFNRSDAADDDQVLMRQSSDIVIHPDFDPRTFQHDIALVRLNSSVPYSGRVLPVCLPTPDTTVVNLVPGNKGYISGWGLTENDSLPTELLMARLEVLTAAQCEASFRAEGLNVSVGPDRFCAGSTRERRPNACRGDSGSPLVFYANDTARFSVEGVVSASRRDECRKAARYTLFTRVSFYLDWIRDNWNRTEK